VATWLLVSWPLVTPRCARGSLSMSWSLEPVSAPAVDLPIKGINGEAEAR
jgi:hypothetical protein